MPCPHKFERDLNLDRLDFEPATLIVGTFNPAWPDSNTAPWFYGRTASNWFWEVLPRLYGQPSLLQAKPAAWKRFCHNHRIALTDFIRAVEDADPDNPQHVAWLGGFRDDALAAHFFDFDRVNLVRLLRQHPTITQIYVTRSLTESFWKQQAQPLQRYTAAAGIRVTPLLTPSGYASFQQGRHNKTNPAARLSLPDYILYRWREVWHPLD